MKKHKEMVVDMLTRGISPRIIIQTLRQEYPLLAIQPRDVYNLKQRLYLEFLEGRTPIQALIQEAIPGENVWKFRVQTDENNRVTALLENVLRSGSGIHGCYLWIPPIRQIVTRCLCLTSLDAMP